VRHVTAAVVLACAVSSMDVRADGENEAFKRWAQGLSDAQHLPICAWGTLAHAASRNPGRFVWLNDPTRQYAHWLVFESAGRRWWTRHEERAAFGGEELSCDRKVPLTWMKLQALTLQFLDQSNVPDIKQVITLIDGDVVLLSDHRAGYHDDFFTNWVTGLNSFHDPHPLDDERSEPEQQPMIFALPEGSRWWPKLPVLRPEITFGQKRWTGKDDADLAVRVVVVPEGLKVELDARDDQRILPAAGADARAIVRADHFELWFCADQHSIECGERPAQLGVARTADGGAVARWLRPHPANRPIPAVSVERERLAVLLPRSLIDAVPGPGGFPILVPLTVAYSDSDDASAGQQTMIATAAIKKANPKSPSLLAIADGDRPFPRWNRATPLAPGEAMFAEDPVCGERAIERERAGASAAIASGRSADGTARLATLIKTIEKGCTGRLSDEVRLNLHVDLAGARQKAGDDAGCLSALADVARYTEPKPLARSIMFNQALCGGECDSKRPGCLEGKTARAGKPTGDGRR